VRLRRGESTARRCERVRVGGTTRISYKTHDRIAEGDSTLNPTPTDVDDVDGGTIVDSARCGGGVDDGIGVEDVDDVDNAWLSATRTLGSLFLRQEDAERATHAGGGGGGGRRVDDAPALLPPTVVVASPPPDDDDDDDGGGGGVREKNTFAQIMMGLKLQQEENNREMMAANDNSDRGIVRPRSAKDVMKTSGGGDVVDTANQATTGDIKINPVSSFFFGGGGVRSRRFFLFQR
jgi:hypothetical protein